MEKETTESHHLIDLGGETLRRLERLIPIGLTVAVGVVVLYNSQYLRGWFTNGMWPIFVLAIAALLLILVVRVGFTVIKAFFLVSTELSLVIFLSQSYCSASRFTLASDSALRSLLLVSFSYIGFAFFGALYESLKESLAKIGEGRGTFRKIVVSAGYLLLAAICVGWIYAIMRPIVMSLCVFQ